jgi:DNA-binding NtrC family response regulator
MYAEYLRKAGFEVHEAGTTDRALELAPHVTAVITGLLVPGSMDAIEFIRRVHREWNATPVVVLTSDAQVDRMVQARAAGAEEILQAPCVPDALLRAVEEAIEANDARRSIPPARRRLSDRRAVLRGGGRRDSDTL